MNSTTPLNIALGLNIDGKPVHTSIAKMPHGLIAGGTGSGKSVCVNGLLVSLLLKYSPADLKLILVDPKQVELISYQELPHLATPVITDPKMASEALKWACDEMDRRYRAFASVRVRDIEGFNEKTANDPSIKKTPYLVIVIDELYDLMMTAGQDVEASIQRITQMGRAAGIHLIVATQRPTTDVIKGTIKANIPCRIAFKVSQFVDSTTILDQGGAESLLGRGDMLFKVDDLPVRIQGAYISDSEISRVCDYIRDNYAPDYIFTHEELQNKVKQQYGAVGSKDSEDMELLYSVALYVIERETCSINSIQTTFKLGFRRAQRIVEILEEMGIVSGSKGTTGREILVTQEEVERKFKTGE
jgi:S-DNA-T family DNA segregation ATPase FtsK/SpoIIIE